MSLSLNFSAEQSDDGTTISITDLTGIFSATLNAGGFNSPNPTTASATAATITLYQLLDGNQGIYSDAIIIDAYPTLPNTTETVFEFTAEDAGYGLNAIFPDAVYKLIYTVTGDSGGAYTATTTLIFAFTHDIDCAIKTLSNKVALCSCDCDQLFATYQKVSAQKRLYDAAVCCGDVQQIFKYIAFLDSELENCNCGC